MVLFHVGVPIAGYIGVDVFFAISGFVIAALILRELDSAGTFRIRRFWARRFVRLMPALALLVVVTSVVSWLVLLPQQRDLTAATGIGSMLFVANVVIARTTGNYFDPPAESNPLLNTWSLSVEEQFYIGFPLLLVLALWLLKNRISLRVTLAATIAAISLGSFAVMLLADLGVLTQTWLNFYDPIQRAWEFGAGALLALVPSKIISGRRLFGAIAAVTAVVLLAAALLTLRSPATYPSVATLLPVGSTVLFIVAGMAGANFATRLLATRPMIAVGDMSYSIYLWHWPAISIAILLGVESTALLALVAALSLIPAWASYRFVESPLRRRMSNAGRVSWRVPATTLGAPLLAGSALLVLPGAATGLEGDTELGYLDFITANSTECERLSISVPGTRCRQSQLGRDPQVIVVGDSHGEHLFPGLIDELASVPSAYVYLEDWPSIVSEDSVGVVQQIAGNAAVDTVVLSARWNEVNVRSPQLMESAQVLRDAGKTVVILDDVPYFEFHAMECQYARLIGPRPRCTMPIGEFLTFRERYLPGLREVASTTGSDLIEVGGLFCTEESCSMVRDGVIHYADNGHLNREGSRALIREVRGELS